jgi:hypothetical protein
LSGISILLQRSEAALFLKNCVFNVVRVPKKVRSVGVTPVGGVSVFKAGSH